MVDANSIARTGHREVDELLALLAGVTDMPEMDRWVRTMIAEELHRAIQQDGSDR